ncbi:MAG: hypothetical protein ACI8UO_001093 [Verrucomicrobiales bacterium]
MSPCFFLGRSDARARRGDLPNLQRLQFLGRLIPRPTFTSPARARQSNVGTSIGIRPQGRNGDNNRGRGCTEAWRGDRQAIKAFEAGLADRRLDARTTWCRLPGRLPKRGSRSGMKKAQSSNSWIRRPIQRMTYRGVFAGLRRNRRSSASQTSMVSEIDLASQTLTQRVFSCLMTAA